MGSSGSREQRGFIVVSLFIERAGSVDQLRRWADTAAAIYRDQTTGTVWLGEPSEMAGDPEQDEWLMWQVHVPYLNIASY